MRRAAVSVGVAARRQRTQPPDAPAAAWQSRSRRRPLRAAAPPRGGPAPRPRTSSAWPVAPRAARGQPVGTRGGKVLDMSRRRAATHLLLLGSLAAVIVAPRFFAAGVALAAGRHSERRKFGHFCAHASNAAPSRLRASCRARCVSSPASRGPRRGGHGRNADFGLHVHKRDVCRRRACRAARRGGGASGGPAV